MSTSGEREPLVPSRGVLVASEFCRATGLDESTVAALVAAGELDGLVHRDGRLFGLFDDTLPAPADLRALGLTIDAAYDPGLLRSHEEADDVDDDADDGGYDENRGAEAGRHSWTIVWPD